MGHIRLGRLPRTIRWVAVVEELNEPSSSSTRIANQTLHAANSGLKRAAEERGCYLPLLALSRLVLAARTPSQFDRELEHLGISQENREDGLRLLAALHDSPAALSRRPGPEGGTERRTALTEIAERAYREVIAARIREQSSTLWGVSPDDVRRTFDNLRTAKGYSELAREWFGRFVGRTIQYFVDRELSNSVGKGIAQTSAQAVRLERQLLAYAQERSQILREYAPSWLSKTLWTQGQINEGVAQKFFGHAISKILADVERERSDA